MRLGRKLAEGFAVDSATDAEAERRGPAAEAMPGTVEVTVASDAPQAPTPAERPLPV